MGGVLKRTALTSKVKTYFYYGDHHLVTKSTAQEADSGNDVYSGSLACEEESGSTTNVVNCLNNSDIFTILDFTNSASNHTVSDIADALIADAAADDTLNQPLRRGTNI